MSISNQTTLFIPSAYKQNIIDLAWGRLTISSPDIHFQHKKSVSLPRSVRQHRGQQSKTERSRHRQVQVSFNSRPGPGQSQPVRLSFIFLSSCLSLSLLVSPQYKKSLRLSRATTVSPSQTSQCAETRPGGEEDLAELHHEEHREVHQLPVNQLLLQQLRPQIRDGDL